MVKTQESKSTNQQTEHIPIPFANINELINAVTQQQSKNHSKDKIAPQVRWKAMQNV